MAQTNLLKNFTKTKYQTKVYSGSVASLTFNNLVVGKAYRASAFFAYSNINNLDGTLVLFNGDGSSISTIGLNQTLTGTIVGYVYSTEVFIYTGSAGLTAGKGGSGDLVAASVTLEELPNHEVTTQWT